MSIYSRCCGIALASLLFLLTGCSGDGSQSKSGDVKPQTNAGHPDEGPHGGHLIELGKEEYHVEMVHDDKAGEVTFYVLDGTAKKAVPIDATELVVNLKHAGTPEQFKIAAKPDNGDQAGKSSRFFSAEKDLAEALDAEGADAQLVAVINGTQYRGAIAHEHGNEEHAGHKD